jgi:hypothetical protein
MESSESTTYLALSDSHPEYCGSMVVRRASFGDIEALASELPMLSQRSYRIGSDQGIVVLAAAVIDRRYRWVVTLEQSIDSGASEANAVEINELPHVPGQTVDRFKVRGFVEGDRASERFGDRSVLVESD